MKIKKILNGGDEPNKEPKYKDLREVMDYTRDFAMFYSGVEYEVYLDGCYDMGIRDFLMSYEYLKGRQGSETIRKHPDMSLFIDSGAFTYMSDPKYADYTIEQWEKQIVEYLAWAERYKDCIFAIAELDLQYLVGIETVQKWRREYFEPFMLKTGVPVCFIYHADGMNVWEQMCQRYPFVGFSSVSDSGLNRTKEDYSQMIKVAEKYNSLVHGFGMTRTSMLPELPFYTVDSTSWKAGFRYGLLSVWTGKIVRQVKKDEWDSKAYPFIDNYKDIELDKKLLEDYYEPEILRASVYAYDKAQDYIIESLQSLSYWKKAKATKVDMDNLPEDFFKPQEWFKEMNGYEDYARKLNVNPEYEGARDLIYDITAILNWDNEDYAKMKLDYIENPELINGLHDYYINRITQNDEEKVEDLAKFFSDCVSGENETLLHIGTNFDRVVHERDDYVEEETHDIVDVDMEEVKSRLANILPKPSGEDPAPDITELDDEIFSEIDIVPVRDDKGRFLKGQTLVKKPKQLYSKKYPKFACDTCHAGGRCPEYKAGYVCAFVKMFDRYNTRDMGDIIESMQGIVSHNMTRMQKAMVMETVNGIIDPLVSQLMDTNMRYLNQLRQMYEYGSPEVLRKTTTMRADGSVEETLTATNPQGGGILEKLFSMSSDKEEKIDLDDPDIIDEDIQEIEVEGESD